MPQAREDQIPLPANSTPIRLLASVEEAESDWQSARQVAEQMRTAAASIRTALATVDLQVSRARRQRQALEKSLDLSRSAAYRNGVAGTPMMRQRLFMLEEAIGKVRDDTRRLIEMAAPLCLEFDSAYDALRRAKLLELEALQILTKQRGNRGDVAADERARDKELRAELNRLEQLRDRDLEEQRIQSCSDQDGHYDPGYDEREIWERRNRPWL